MQKTNQKYLRIEKVIKKKANKLYLKWKGCDKWFNCWIDKNDLIKRSQYFPKPCKPFGGDINVKVDLYNYGIKSDLKNATGIETSKLVAKCDFLI